jgi:hypothetical protein
MKKENVVSVWKRRCRMDGEDKFLYGGGKSALKPTLAARALEPSFAGVTCSMTSSALS